MVSLRARPNTTRGALHGTPSSPPHLSSGQATITLCEVTLWRHRRRYCTDDTRFRWSATPAISLMSRAANRNAAEGIRRWLSLRQHGARGAWLQGAAQPKASRTAFRAYLSRHGGVLVGKTASEPSLYRHSACSPVRPFSPFVINLEGWTLTEATDVSDEASIVVVWN